MAGVTMVADASSGAPSAVWVLLWFVPAMFAAVAVHELGRRAAHVSPRWRRASSSVGPPRRRARRWLLRRPGSGGSRTPSAPPTYARGS